jgi:hypothetical protein
MICPLGQYSIIANSSSCIQCADGSYQDNYLHTNLCFQGSFTSSSGSSSWSLCGAGHFSGLLNATACAACAPGSFSSQAGKTKCATCLSGKYSVLAALECLLCQRGTYNNWTAQSSCFNCTAGTFGDSFGSSSCKWCPQGTYSEQEALVNSTKCLPCPAGHFSSVSGLRFSKQCTRCAPGKTAIPGSTTCINCGQEEFPNPIYGSCATCPLQRSSLPNASSLEICSCNPGFHAALNAKASGGDSYYTYRGGSWLKFHVFHQNNALDVLLLLYNTAIEIFCNGQSTGPASLWTIGTYAIKPSVSCPPPVTLSYQVDLPFNGSETHSHIACIPCAPGRYQLLV